MTISYSGQLATATFLSQFKILFRWKGSVWKAAWKELVLWSLLFLLLSAVYRYFMNDWQRDAFEKLCTFFDSFSALIPVTFMLGLYVSVVYNRWRFFLDNFGLIDTAAIAISQNIRGTSERARIIRRNCIRYMVVGQVLVYRDISPVIRKRFPTMESLVDAGLLWKHELIDFDSIKTKSKLYLPIQWAISYLTQAYEDGLIPNYYLYIDVVEVFLLLGVFNYHVQKVRIFREKIIMLFIYDLIPIPLVWTQVVMLSVRVYFLVAVLGRQFLAYRPDIEAKYKYDLYYPIMSAMEIVFLIGWVKASEVMMNPFGEDDDDFESNWIIDRNLEMGYACVDQSYNQIPKICRDPYWAEETPRAPYRPEEERRQQFPMEGSAVNSDVKPEEDSSFFGVFHRKHKLNESISKIKHYLPSGHSMSKTESSSKTKVSEKHEDRRHVQRTNSVCVAAIDLNHRTTENLRDVRKSASLATILNGQVLKPEMLPEGQVLPSPRTSCDEYEDVKWFIDELPTIKEEETIHSHADYKHKSILQP